MTHYQARHTHEEAAASWARYHREHRPEEDWAAFERRCAQEAAPPRLLTVALRRTAAAAFALWTFAVIAIGLHSHDDGRAREYMIDVGGSRNWFWVIGIVFVAVLIYSAVQAADRRDAAKRAAYRAWVEANWEGLTPLQQEEAKRRLFPADPQYMAPSIGAAMMIADARGR
jgi:hypothetical protein